ANLGITPADRKKKLELDNQLVEKLKAALPYWEKAEKMNPTEMEVLDALSSIYGDLGMTAQSQRIEQRYKELGQDNRSEERRVGKEYRERHSTPANKKE